MIINEPMSVWEILKESQNPIILYGMGDGADKVLKAFEKYEIKASGVMASDEFVRGQSFKGFKVKKLSEIEQEYKDFTIALCFASQIDEVMNKIKDIAQKHTMLVPSVPVFGDKIFDKKFIEENSNDINEVYEILADNQSKKVYKNILNFYYTGKLELLDEITTAKDEAFQNILRLGDNEAYVDLGAYNGDTIEEFLQYSNKKYRKITALEPNHKNFEKLKKYCKNTEKVDLWELGAWNCNTTLEFNNKAGRNSAIADNGTKTRVVAVDNILCGLKATYIKADVEGADYEMLEGLQNTLRNFKPKLNISAYHRFEDIFRLAKLIKEINPEYKIYLRHHPYIPAWDTNLYCV